MSISWFCFWRNPDPTHRLSAEDHRGIVALLRACPGLVEGRVYTLIDAGDVYFNEDGPGPFAALQLEFADVASLEANLRRHGYLAKLAETDFLTSTRGGTAEQQAMLTRKFPVPEPGSRAPDGSLCTFLVEYPGEAEDYNAWLAYYVSHHPQIMAKFPGIREAEVLTPIVAISALPWPVSKIMQRNKVVFDSAQALSVATAGSPVIKEMRADFAHFPKFTGNNLHWPMHTVIVKP
jgi:hypothetical protein